MNVRAPGSITDVELKMLIGELTLARHADQLRIAELEAIVQQLASNAAQDEVEQNANPCSICGQPIVGEHTCNTSPPTIVPPDATDEASSA